MSQSKNEKTAIISFRLYPKHLQILTARTNRTGLSVHQEAQTIVECALDDQKEEGLLMGAKLDKLSAERERDAALMRAKLDNLSGEVEAIRAGLVTMFSHFVAWRSNGKTTVEEARAGVEKVFPRKGNG
jgi:hypothetical protein